MILVTEADIGKFNAARYLRHDVFSLGNFGFGVHDRLCHVNYRLYPCRGECNARNAHECPGEHTVCRIERRVVGNRNATLHGKKVHHDRACKRDGGGYHAVEHNKRRCSVSVLRFFRVFVHPPCEHSFFTARKLDLLYARYDLIGHTAHLARKLHLLFADLHLRKRTDD